MPFIGVQPVASATTATSLSGVTSTAAELNILDGVTSTAAELNILDGVTATTAELNYLDITTLGGSEASKVLTANSSGNVGIGTASPSFTGFGSSTGGIDITNSANASLRLNGNAADAMFFVSGSAQHWLYGKGAVPMTFSTNGTERMRIDSSGNLSVGTTSAVTDSISLEQAFNLSWAESANSSYANVFRQRSSAATVLASGYKRSETSNKMDSSVAASWGKTAVWTGSESIRFYTDAASADAVGTDLTPTERMRINSSGNVGIGTTSPAGPLHIQSATNRTIILDGTVATGSFTWQSIRRSGTEKWRWFLENDDDVTLYADVNSTGSVMRWGSDGVVQFDNGISEEYTAVTSSSNATTVNLQDGTNFSHTLTENTTFTFSNPAASGKVSAFTLKLVQDSSASGYTVTWPSSVDWPSATAPTLTATASAVDYFVFITHDGGTTYYGFTAGQALG